MRRTAAAYSGFSVSTRPMTVGAALTTVDLSLLLRGHLLSSSKVMVFALSFTL
jgi:hypothetical protein